MLPTLPRRVRAFEYIGGILYFKMVTFHGRIRNGIRNEFRDQLRQLPKHAQVRDIVINLATEIEYHFNTTRNGEKDKDLTTDVAIYKLDDEHHTLLALEVSYGNTGPRSDLKEQYQAYFARTEGKIRVVICTDVYYAGRESYSATVENLHRSAISVWIMKPGNKNPTTVMDWKPLS